MQSTLKNRSIFCCDNLQVLRGFNNASVDLIYLDPPFNKNKQFTAPIGSQAQGASFKDIFRQEDVKQEQLKQLEKHHKALAEFIASTEKLGNRYNKYYLIYMAIRLVELHRILKPTGSLYLHCDSTMSHYLKLVLDGIFGEENFRNEIVWGYNKWTNAAKHFQRNHDTLLFYSKGSHYVFHKPFVMTEHMKKVLQKGWDSNKVNGIRQLLVYDREKAQKEIANPKYNRVVYRDTSPPGRALSTNWGDINYLSSASKERVGYPTQKPLALLERLISVSSNKGELVLDPFCGCATACVAAERLERKWIGIDVSAKAYELVKKRLKKEVGRPDEIFKKKVIFREGDTAIVQRTDVKPDTRPRAVIKRNLYGDQGGYCKLCDHHFEIRNMEIDHFLAKSKGGGDNYENLQLLCAACNRSKGTKDMAEAKATFKKDE